MLIESNSLRSEGLNEKIRLRLAKRKMWYFLLANFFKYPLKDNLFAFDGKWLGSEDLTDRNEVLYPLESFASLVSATTVTREPL